MSEFDGGSSPWEIGDVPVRAEPLEITWDAPEPSDESDSTGAATSATRRWAVGAAAAAVLLVAAVVAWPRSDDAGVADSTPVTLDSVPSVTEPVDERGDDRDQQPTEADDEAGRVDSEAASTSLDGELPPAVAAITSPTEIVVQSVDGKVHTVSLPSGTIRTVDLGFNESFGGGNLIVSDDATMIGADDRATFIVPREGIPIRLDGAPFDEADQFGNRQVNPYGYVTGPDGASAFIVAVYEPTGDRRSDFLVSSSGEVTPVPDAAASDFSDPIRAHGVRLVNDAGGVYRVDDGVAVRISDGRAVGTSRRDLLVHECDSSLRCAFSVVDFSGENRRDVVLPPDLGRTYGLQLSPDASAVTFISYGQRNQQVIVGFDGGSTTTPVAGFGGAAWASNGAGVFALAPEGGLMFVDRATGDSEVFAEQLGQLSAIDIRFPDAELETITAVVKDVIGLAQPAVDDVDLRVAVLSDLDTMSILDLDSLTSTSWTTPTTTGSLPPRIFDLGDRLVVIAASGNSGFSTVPGDAAPIDDDLLPDPPFALDPDGIGIWTRSPDDRPGIDQVVNPLRELDTGFSPRTVIAPDGDVLGDDGAGSLVIESGGDVYAADGATLTRLTTGDLLAVSPSSAVVRECDDALVCDEFIVDRATGDRTEIDAPTAFTTAVDADRDVSLVGSLSPDGQTVLIEVALVDDAGGPTTGWSFLDLVGDIQTPIEAPDDDQPIIWNDDGSYAAFLTDGRLALYEASTHTIIDVLQPSGLRAVGRVDGDLPTQ